MVLDKLDVGEPLEMTVKGSSGTAMVLKNILVGEVWVCSGQSNMELPLSPCKNAQEEIAAAQYPQDPLVHGPEKQCRRSRKSMCKGNWAECSPATVPGFSAVAYFFGRDYFQKLGVPVGLIHTSWGGTAAQLWTSRKVLESDPVLKVDWSPAGSGLYNGMIAPLIPYAIRGAIWYQGESNIGGRYQYRTLFPSMIANWRADWGQGEFPFGFVQIAPFFYGGQDPALCAELREAQLLTLKASPNTGMAVTMDIGELKDIHPKNKQDVGKRLAIWALAKVYGQRLVYSGPIYKSMTIEGRKIRLQFRHVVGGLVSADGKPLTQFTIAGADQKFVPAVAEIDGKTILVHSDQVAEPVAVRYAWRHDAQPNLANKAGLPASPFRTDAWKGLTEPR